jgi:hypothetical protein
MDPAASIPDEAFVVRCGVPPFLNSPLILGCRTHPEGPYGFSVQSAAGLTVAELAAACRNNVVGYMIAGDIRALGYDVVRTGGAGHHATVIVPEDWSPEAAEILAARFHRAENRGSGSRK